MPISKNKLTKHIAYVRYQTPTGLPGEMKVYVNAEDFEQATKLALLKVKKIKGKGYRIVGGFSVKAQPYKKKYSRK